MKIATIQRLVKNEIDMKDQMQVLVNTLIGCVTY